MGYTTYMKESAFIPSLLPLSIVALGMDYMGGYPVLHALMSTLSQNGF